MVQIFNGIRILDCSSYMGGPMAARLLAEFGAEVIKVERPTGDPFRASPWFAIYNRSKKGVVINLKSPAGREAMHKLVGTADVLIESFMPGAAQRLGIDYETLSTLNPRLVYCSVPGFGKDGPYADVPGWEQIVQGYATIQNYNGGLRKLLHDPIIGRKYGYGPVWSVLPFASTYNGTQTAYAIGAALVARERTGKGQFMENSLFSSMLSAIAATIVRYPGVMYTSSPDQRGNPAIYRSYQGKDGVWFFLAAGNERMVQNLYVAVDRPEWISDTRLTRFAPLSERQDQVKGELEEIFATKDTAEWLEILRAADVPADYVNTVEQFMKDPQLLPENNDMVAEWEDSVLGRMKGAKSPVKASETPPEVQGPAPILGQDTMEILGALGYTEQEITALVR